MIKKHKSQLISTLETGDSDYKPKTNLIEGNPWKIIKQKTKKRVKKALAFEKEKKKANLGKPSKAGLISKIHNPLNSWTVFN
jgi:hypothetical protein